MHSVDLFLHRPLLTACTTGYEERVRDMKVKSWVDYHKTKSAQTSGYGNNSKLGLLGEQPGRSSVCGVMFILLLGLRLHHQL